MLSCIKSGFYASTPSGLFLYGDAFVITDDWNDEFNCGYGDEPRETPGDHLLLRITAASVEEPPRLNIELETWSHWFDEQEGNVVNPSPNFGCIWRPNSTMIVSPRKWFWRGY